MNTSKIQITDPEQQRQFRLFGKIITLLTRERLRILKSQKQSAKEASNE